MPGEIPKPGKDKGVARAELEAMSSLGNDGRATFCGLEYINRKAPERKLSLLPGCLYNVTTSASATVPSLHDGLYPSELRATVNPSLN